MNSLYHKVGVVSVCTALSFTLGPNQEAKAATFTLRAPSFFIGGVNDITYSEYSGFTTSYSVEKLSDYEEGTYYDVRAFYEFNIGNLFSDPNTVIKRAILNTPLSNAQLSGIARTLDLELLGYIGNGDPDLSDFYAGGVIANGSVFTSPYPPRFARSEINFDVTNFIKQRVSNGDNFAGLSIRVENFYRNSGSVDLRNYYGQEPTLTIETEPVPEPTTIFGSALALGLGGWLKRKKLSQHNKTTSQH